MRKKTGEGTKIAQAAKELGVTSVTIRRYITEFNIETTSDENGIKVLPAQAMDELAEIRKLKEEGLTNPKVLEILEESRTKVSEKPKSKKEKDKDKEEKEKEKEKEKEAPVARRVARKVQEAPPAASRRKAKEVRVEEEEDEEEEEAEDETEEVAEQKGAAGDDDESGEEKEPSEAPVQIISADGKSKYSLTCQTCNKTFEHMNPRLRDCLDCYRIKRKERRRGGDKHKNVIQNPLAQQVVSKNQQLAQQQQQGEVEPVSAAAPAPAAVLAPRERVEPRKVSVREQLNFAPVGTTPPVYQQRSQVRSYRKAIEETRQITSNLKRRLERPDLPEVERRFLERIYAYQLILHQGWKHLSEYKQGDGGGGGNRGES